MKLSTLAVLILWAALSAAQTFNATALTDFNPSQTYHGLAGYLYDGSNHPSTAQDANFAAAGWNVRPLDHEGNPCTVVNVLAHFVMGYAFRYDANCAIVLISAGHSIPEREFCGDQINGGTCFPGSLVAIMSGNSLVNPNVVPINCAEEGAGTFNWYAPSTNVFPRCKNLLTALGLSTNQVQVVMWDGVDNQPQARGLTSLAQFNGTCATIQNLNFPPVGTPDYCEHIQIATGILGLMKKNWPRLQQVLIEEGAYEGFFDYTNSLPYTYRGPNPSFHGCNYQQFLCPINQPFLYELGFAKKALVHNQATATNPVVMWGPYLWAPACSLGTRADGLCYNRNIFTGGDGMHPSASPGIPTIAQLVLNALLNNPYLPWLR